MDANFWHDKWAKKQIGFHADAFNAFMVKYFSTLKLAKNARVFVPLCGKTRDMHWLLDQGHHVIGAELSDLAVREFFEDLKLEPKITTHGAFSSFTAPNIEIFVGDIFDLSAEEIGRVDAIYDRAALVALPHEMRLRYSQHLGALTQNAPQILITFEYDQSLMTGPPFAISRDHVHENYQAIYDIEMLETLEIQGGFKNSIPATETCWRLAVAGQ